MEKYIIINEFDNYAISNYGNIKNIKKNKILKPYLNKWGYLQYTFCQNQIKKTFKIHRLVGLYFVDNPKNFPYVIHKDGDKTNNNSKNLEWSLKKDCSVYPDEAKEKPIKAINLLTNESLCFKSVSEAGAFLGININNISKVLHKKRNQTHNYYFEFL